MHRIIVAVGAMAADPNVMRARRGKIYRELQFRTGCAGSDVSAVVGGRLHVAKATKAGHGIAEGPIVTGSAREIRNEIFRFKYGETAGLSDLGVSRRAEQKECSNP